MKNIKPKKKNRFLTFCLSFMPGAAEMYMGFMKMGTSIMALFIASFAGVVVGMDFMGTVSLLIWFIGFFHAHNIAGADDEIFSEIEDEWIWTEFFGDAGIKISDSKKRTGVAAVLIIVGLTLLWNTVVEVIDTLIPQAIWDYYYSTVRNVFYSVPQFVISILIIILGIKLIKGKKKELLLEDQNISNS
ncbi:MAG: hypothetical protein K6A23_06360 [Butyrivibrio sp.]|nr:hypothetical protein [Butyrivibrio sp.]